MQSGGIPFQFEMSEALAKARRIARKHIGNVTLNLPFISITVNPDDREKLIAREIVIRLRDRRVLSAWECCDDCIERALKSLQEIRQFLVEKEVELSTFHDGPLFLLIDMMAAGVRQFLTYEQQLSSRGAQYEERSAKNRQRRFANAQQNYFDGLETLRNHLSHCLGQIAAIADIEAPANGLIEKYRGDWNLSFYKPLALPMPESVGNGPKAVK